MILSVALALAAAQPATEQPSGVSLTEAGRAIAAVRLDQALSMLGSAVAAGARGEPVDRLLADLSYASGEYDRALGLYRALLTSHPDEALLLERAGIAALRLGRTAEATSLLDRATRTSNSWSAWNARGVAADRNGRWDESEAAYARAAELGASRAEVPNNLGWSMMLQGRWSDALSSFERAAAIDPKLPKLANNLELARAALAAELPQRQPGESDEGFAARLNDAGVVAAAAGQPKRAEAAFAQAISLRSRWYARAADNLAALGTRP